MDEENDDSPRLKIEQGGEKGSCGEYWAVISETMTSRLELDDAAAAAEVRGQTIYYLWNFRKRLTVLHHGDRAPRMSELFRLPIWMSYIK